MLPRDQGSFDAALAEFHDVARHITGKRHKGDDSSKHDRAMLASVEGDKGGRKRAGSSDGDDRMLARLKNTPVPSPKSTKKKHEEDPRGSAMLARLERSQPSKYRKHDHECSPRERLVTRRVILAAGA